MYKRKQLKNYTFLFIIQLKKIKVVGNLTADVLSNKSQTNGLDARAPNID